MTRKEQIEKAAIMFFTHGTGLTPAQVFIRGAEWADKNPAEYSAFEQARNKLIENIRCQLAVAVGALKECANDTPTHYGCIACSGAIARIESMNGDIR